MFELNVWSISSIIFFILALVILIITIADPTARTFGMAFSGVVSLFIGVGLWAAYLGNKDY